MSRPAGFVNEDLGDEEDDEDFNPVQGNDSDAEGEADAKPSGRHASAEPDGQDETNGADEDDGAGGEQEEEGEEDEDEDDDEEEDEDDAVGRPRKKRRQQGGVANFIDTMAEVSDDEAEEEEEEEMNEAFVDQDDFALPSGAEHDDRRHRELDRQREVEASMDAEKQAQALKERYGRNRGNAADVAVVPKRLLLPSVNDPSIWAVKCRPGKEREVVFNIMKRMEERRPGSRKPCRIISVFERGGTMSGYIYVEARRQADVIEGLDQLTNVYIRSKLTLISVKEMPDLLRVQKSEELHPGAWVRIKRGKYMNDLAQIEDVETNGLDVTVRIVPRLEYGLNEDSRAPVDGKRKRIGGNSAIGRPPQRLFSESEAKKRHAKYLTAASGLGGKSWNYLGETYVDGFLIKDMKIQHLITKNVNPQLDEVTKFAKGAEDGTSNLDLTSLAASLKNTTNEDAYLPGDTVEVYDGEQRGVVGKTIATHGDIVTLKVTEGGLEGQQVDVPVKGLRKRFHEGDHVKVIGGSRYRDELGMVVDIKDDRVTIVSDMSMQHITVFSKDLREAADTGVDGKLGIYDVQDLVQLDSATVGCVVKLDSESMRVLDQNGSIRNVLPSQVMNKIEPRRNAVSTDRQGSEIRAGDTVREITAERRTGTILHVHRAFLFLHSRNISENSGIIVTRASNVTTIAAGVKSMASRPGPDPSKMNPAFQRNSNMPPPRGGGRDKLIGQTVAVRRGTNKGLIGIVKSATDIYARVELHAKSTLVNVDRNDLILKDPYTGATLDPSILTGGGRGRGAGVGSSAAPPGMRKDLAGSRTPMIGNDSARTPIWRASSARTPAWSMAASGSRTPAWRNDGSRTSNPYDGNRTAYGGPSFSNRTPAWQSGSKTPYDSNGGLDPFAAGSRTPAWNSGSRTPAVAPTPGADYLAPTPGAYMSAPTPGAFGSAAPTPGFSPAAATARWPDSAPTPGGDFGIGKREMYDDAPTPAGLPATPGIDDTGPRYEDSPSP